MDRAAYQGFLGREGAAVGAIIGFVERWEVGDLSRDAQSPQLGVELEAELFGFIDGQPVRHLRKNQLIEARRPVTPRRSHLGGARLR